MGSKFKIQNDDYPRAVHFEFLILNFELISWTHRLKLDKPLVVSGVSSPPMNKGLKPLVYILNVIMVAVLAPRSTSLSQIGQQVEKFLESHQFLSAEQVQKTLTFIFSLVA